MKSSWKAWQKSGKEQTLIYITQKSDRWVQNFDNRWSHKFKFKQNLLSKSSKKAQKALLVSGETVRKGLLFSRPSNLPSQFTFPRLSQYGSPFAAVDKHERVFWRISGHYELSSSSLLFSWTAQVSSGLLRCTCWWVSYVVRWFAFLEVCGARNACFLAKKTVGCHLSLNHSCLHSFSCISTWFSTFRGCPDTL